MANNPLEEQFWVENSWIKILGPKFSRKEILQAQISYGKKIMSLKFLKTISRSKILKFSKTKISLLKIFRNRKKFKVKILGKKFWSENFERNFRAELFGKWKSTEIFKFQAKTFFLKIFGHNFSTTSRARNFLSNIFLSDFWVQSFSLKHFWLKIYFQKFLALNFFQEYSA